MAEQAEQRSKARAELIEDRSKLRTERADLENICGPDLLIMLPPMSTLFDNVSTSGSQVSELSEPFSDFGHIPEEETSRDSQDLSEQDLYTALVFSSDFKSVMEDIKAENLKSDPALSQVSSMMAESFEQIRLGSLFPQSHRKIPMGTQMKIVSLLNEKAFRFSPESSDEEPEQVVRPPKIKSFIPDEKKTWEDIKDEILGGKKDLMRGIKKLKKKEQSKKKMIMKEEELAYETMSGYWRLLSVYDDFKISPPGFDAYELPQPHWLQTKPVPLTVFEESRKKCLEWLSKHFENY